MNPGSSDPIASGQFFYCKGLDPQHDNCVVEGDQEPVTLFGTAAMPAARRLYRGIELLARYDAGSRLWLQASYVFSSLRGNYDGEVE